MRVWVVHSSNCADRDVVYGVYSTKDGADRCREDNLSEWDWPNFVKVSEWELDGVDMTDVVESPSVKSAQNG